MTAPVLPEGDERGLAVYLLTSLHAKVDSLTERFTEHKGHFERHVTDDAEQFSSVRSENADILAKLEPLVSEQQFHERVKTAVDDSKAARRSGLLIWAQIIAGLAAAAAVGVSITALLLTHHL